ncbi:Rb1-inducible coiled-coil protein 1, partial [Plakobranchus ocellatus]
MLYVFRMDIGQMLTIDMSFLMDTIARLQVEIARITGIPVEKQILLVSGGHSVKPDQKVMSYGAGADTNPVFLFSRKAIESQEPPIIRLVVSKDVLTALKDSLNKVMSMPPQIESVSLGTKIACQIRDSAVKILSFCKNEFKEQHLQYQGWGTVVANLEEIAQALHHSKMKFSKAAAAFLPIRDQYFTMLENFPDAIELLQRIPLLKALQQSETVTAKGAIPFSKSVGSSHSSFLTSSSFIPSTLLEWITTQGQGQSLETLSHKCYQDLLVFNSQLFELFNQRADEVLKEVTTDPLHNKELLGIERRLSDLEKRCNEATRIAEEQNDVTQNFFLKHASSLSKTADVASLLPNLCQTHKQQLRQMVERQQRIEALQNNFLKSKQEMSTNIHQRLSWVMHVETSIAQLDNDLIFHLKSLKILQCNLELLSQVKVAPKVYADIVIEANRRRTFSHKFSQWAEALVEDTTHLYSRETDRRKQFAKTIGDHFLLDTLFKGFDDMPPNFATKAPNAFDCDLPEITENDVELLRSAMPELKESLKVCVESSSLPSSFAGKERTDSPFAHIVFPTCQSSQTEWAVQPSIVKATEAPPTKFTLPELQESTASQNIPQVSADQPHTGLGKAVAVTSRLGGDGAPTPASSSVPTMTSALTNSVSSVPVLKSSAPQVAAGSCGPSRSHHPAIAASPTEREQHPRMGMSPPHTESISPPSSNEFATADFYFEDSMPSPLASSSEKQKDNSTGSDSKQAEEAGSNVGTLVASLQAELATKETLIRELEEKLKENPPPHLQYHQDSALSENSVTVGPCLSSSDATSTPPMEDALDISLVVGKFEALRNTDVHMEQLQQSLDQVTSDLAKARADLLLGEKLKQDLEQANIDLAKAKDNLLQSELDLSEKEEANKRVLQEKDSEIHSLTAKLEKAKMELSKAVSVEAEQKKNMKILQGTITSLEAKSKDLSREVNLGKESLKQVKKKLIVARDSLIQNLSPLRQDLVELRSSVVSDRTELQATVISTISSVEREISQFNEHMLASARAEKDALQAEIQHLKAKLHAAESATAEQVVHLQSVREDHGTQILHLREEAAEKLKEAKAEYESSLKDQETKHALELELELDKCGAELKEKEETLARQAEDLAELKDQLAREIREAKQAADEEREQLALAYSNNLRQAEESNSREREVISTRLRKEFELSLETSKVEADERLTKYQAQQEAARHDMQKEHEDAIKSLREQLEKDKEEAIFSLNEQLNREQEEKLISLREQLVREHEKAMAELRDQGAELKESLTLTLEQTQMDHANKLTNLKTEFDKEREALQAELAGFRDRPRADSSTEPDSAILALHQVCGQTQTEGQEKDNAGIEWSMKMTTSQTQTDMNLLADVISLNSSISYGSEEMIAHKLSASLTADDKDSKASSIETFTATAATATAATSDGTSSNMQDTVDELNVQLVAAQVKIASLSEEIRVLKDKTKESSGDSSQLQDEASAPSDDVTEVDGDGAVRVEPGQAGNQDMLASASTVASFILMDGEQLKGQQGAQVEPEVIKSKDQRIAYLEKRLNEATKDKISIRGCEKNDIVLLCLDEAHDQYIIFTVATYLHFLHSDSIDVLELRS